MNVIVDKRDFLTSDLAGVAVSFEYMGVPDRAMCAFGQAIARRYFGIQELATEVGALSGDGRVKVWVKSYFAGLSLVAIGLKEQLVESYMRLKDVLTGGFDPAEEKELAVLFEEVSSLVPYYEADPPVIRGIRSLLYREVFRISDDGLVDLRDMSKILLSIGEGRNVSVVVWNMYDEESLGDRPIFVPTGLPKEYEFEDTTVVGIEKDVSLIFKPFAAVRDYAAAYDFAVAAREQGYRVVLQRIMDYILIAIWGGDLNMVHDIRPSEDISILRKEMALGLEGRMKLWHNLVHFGADAMDEFASAPVDVDLGDVLTTTLKVRGREA